MDLEKLKQAIELMKLLEGNEVVKTNYPLIGKYVIVRTYSAGNFAGIFKERLADGKIVLENCRRLWRWQTANNGISLSEIATYGINQENSRICCVEPIKILQDIEISPATEIAKRSIEGAKDYVAS